MKRLAAFLAAAVALASCALKNDLDYPVVAGDIVAVSVEGQKSVAIDAKARTVVFSLEEDADIAHLKVSALTVSDGEVVGGVPEYLDLRESVRLTVRTWQDYEWTLSATQSIDRYVRCTGQLGDARFNADTRTVLVYVPESQPLSSVTFEDMKLEAEGSLIQSTTGYSTVGDKATVTTLPVVFPMTLDCVLERTFTVMLKGEAIIWRCKVLQMAISLKVDSVRPYCYHAQVRALFDGQEAPVLEYRAVSSELNEDWTRADAQVAGVGLSADLKGLSADTDYQVRLRRGEETSEPYAFRTGKAEQLHNLSFDAWWQNGKGWYANESAAIKVWDSANPGTSSLGVVPTTPEERDVAVGGPGKRAARLESTTAFGQFAAGNIYVGQFGSVAGLGAILHWGVPFTGRPTALEGYYKYAPQPINKTKDPYASLAGQPDNCSIKIYLTSWTEPFEINTGKKQFLADDDPSVIALGALYSDKTDAEYVRFSLPLEYRDDRIPSYIVISCAASRYGDYFTGGIGSVLLVDEFSFVYE